MSQTSPPLYNSNARMIPMLVLCVLTYEMYWLQAWQFLRGQMHQMWDQVASRNDFKICPHGPQPCVMRAAIALTWIMILFGVVLAWSYLTCSMAADYEENPYDLDPMLVLNNLPSGLRLGYAAGMLMAGSDRLNACLAGDSQPFPGTREYEVLWHQCGGSEENDERMGQLIGSFVATGTALRLTVNYAWEKYRPQREEAERKAVERLKENEARLARMKQLI